MTRMNWYARLNESNTWTDQYGHKIEVAGMEPRDARNVLTYIERHHEGIARAAANALRDVPVPAFHSQAYDEVFRSAEDEAAAIMADPLAWLASTPLVQALADRAALYVARGALRQQISA
ncbi:hypothetical protein [Nonomuraea dietziae]|uniref:hypothetical protein n=1 Tax=Nonomuraea dietziae TaxID=65515 RepID=UPI0033E8A66A